MVPNPGTSWPNSAAVTFDLPGNAGVEAWDRRLLRLLSALEADKAPDVVLLDARSGFHDLSSAVVTELADTVLLFATHSEQTWSGYRLLFEHWQRYGVAERIRERLQLVAALIPETDRDAYLNELHERAWGIFSDHLYDELEPGRSRASASTSTTHPPPTHPCPSTGTGVSLLLAAWRHWIRSWWQPRPGAFSPGSTSCFPAPRG